MALRDRAFGSMLVRDDDPSKNMVAQLLAKVTCPPNVNRKFMEGRHL